MEACHPLETVRAPGTPVCRGRAERRSPWTLLASILGSPSNVFYLPHSKLVYGLEKNSQRRVSSCSTFAALASVKFMSSNPRVYPSASQAQHSSPASDNPRLPALQVMILKKILENWTMLFTCAPHTAGHRRLGSISNYIYTIVSTLLDYTSLSRPPPPSTHF